MQRVRVEQGAHFVQRSDNPLVSTPVNQRAARCRIVQTKNDSHRRCFARAVWSKKPGDVAGKNAETQTVECDDRAEVFGK